MIPSRRDFLEHVASIAALSALPLSLDALPPSAPTLAAEDWDLSWTKRITGKYKAVFDTPEIDSAYGVFRVSFWANQYMDTLKATPKDLSPVLVLRHNAIFLATQQSFWDKYAIGKEHIATHPFTREPTDRNPALLSSSRNEVAAMFDSMALDQYIKRGGIALACNLAFNQVIGIIEKKENLSPEAARTQAKTYLLPGIILQPSGVFASLYAQEFGCKYIQV